nr:DUF3820 family protein [Capnocytophaga ochracea]
MDLFERLKEYRKKKYKNSQKYSVDSDDLKEIITTPMPYGMYKDKMLIDLPFNYLEWLNDKGFFNGKIGKLLAITFEIKKIDKTLL